jgi:endogenous inhibitor of DNA gyrase (YacG/DUF329 family)
MTILTKKCIVCDKEFVTKSKLFCSRVCFYKFQDKRIEKICKICGKKFKRKQIEIEKKGGKFCSYRCYWKDLLGRPNTSKTKFKKGQKAWNKGLNGNNYLSPEAKKKMSVWKDKFENKSPRWKGMKAGYFAKHIHIVKHYGHAPQCEYCKVIGKKIFAGGNRYRWSIEWANVSGKYLRDRNDYVGLCKACHMKFDSGQITL